VGGPITTHEEPSMNCPECGVEPGQLHSPPCDVERCPDCGGQRFFCDCEPGDAEASDTPRLPWSGEWPGLAECREFGWYCRRRPGVLDWVACSADHPDAMEDLNRLGAEGVWDRERGRFVMPGRPAP
jgi:hypothetical protein